MKIPTLIFALFTIFSCKAQSNKLQIETILCKYQIKEIKDTINNKTRNVKTLVEYIKRLEPKITVLSHEKNKIQYQLQGNIHSSGLRITNVKKISSEKVIENNTLILRHYVEIKGIAGKEGGLVKGYNYSKTESEKIPKNINQIKIELITKHITNPNIVNKKIAEVVISNPNN